MNNNLRGQALHRLVLFMVLAALVIGIVIGWMLHRPPDLTGWTPPTDSPSELLQPVK